MGFSLHEWLAGLFASPKARSPLWMWDVSESELALTPNLVMMRDISKMLRRHAARRVINEFSIDPSLKIRSQLRIRFPKTWRVGECA